MINYLLEYFKILLFAFKANHGIVPAYIFMHTCVMQVIKLLLLFLLLWIINYYKFTGTVQRT